MGYDSEGRWIGVDPNDPEDQAEIHESHKRVLYDDYVKQQHAVAKQQYEANQIVAEILEDEGIDQATYQQLLNDSPDIAREAFRSAMLGRSACSATDLRKVTSQHEELSLFAATVSSF
jgi:hypothetical protein